MDTVEPRLRFQNTVINSNHFLQSLVYYCTFSSIKRERLKIIGSLILTTKHNTEDI